MSKIRVLFVPWRQIESIERYATQRDLPMIKNSSEVDYKNVQDPRAWRKMLDPLKEYGVVNKDMEKYSGEWTKDKGKQSEWIKEKKEQEKKEWAAHYGKWPGSEYKLKNEEWRKEEAKKANAKVWVEVWYSGRVSPIIFGLRTADEQIYIRGHGQPGETKISSGPENWALTAKEVAKRLIESGLQRSFAGKIKCYNCHSADPDAGESSFAQALADYMYYSKGYRSCEYCGYYGALDSYPGANDAGSKPDDNSSKTAESKGGLASKHKTSLPRSWSQPELPRASAQRKLIIPKVPKELLAKLEENLAKLKPF